MDTNCSLLWSHQQDLLVTWSISYLSIGSIVYLRAMLSLQCLMKSNLHLDRRCLTWNKNPITWRSLRLHLRVFKRPSHCRRQMQQCVLLLSCHSMIMNLVKQDPWDQAKFEQLLTEWIVACDQPFDEVEKEEFIKLITYVCHPASSVKLPGQDGIHCWVMKMGEETIDKICDMFVVSVIVFCSVPHAYGHIETWEKIVLSLDRWTSSNQYAFLAIIAHYVTNEGQLGHFHNLGLGSLSNNLQRSFSLISENFLVNTWEMLCGRH